MPATTWPEEPVPTGDVPEVATGGSRIESTALGDSPQEVRLDLTDLVPRDGRTNASPSAARRT